MGVINEYQERHAPDQSSEGIRLVLIYEDDYGRELVKEFDHEPTADERAALMPRQAEARRRWQQAIDPSAKLDAIAYQLGLRD